ncbi:acyl-CoA carboxylase subunit beta [Kineococcus esterisolvens]|uniref:acyl-CoA carboxylase subunit beta n=1 Tax=unclassified Kineococcus TaxID=2621656 RepID=UPI003D7ED635
MTGLDAPAHDPAPTGPAEQAGPDPRSTAGKLAELHRRAEVAVAAADERAAAKQHPRGKKTARERIAALVDEGSFVELGGMARSSATAFGMASKHVDGDGVVTGHATVDGRPVAVYAQDFTAFGGSLGEVHGAKIAHLQEWAATTGCPVIGINDGGGARIQEGVASLVQYARIFRRNVHASGVVPQISLIAGPCAGGAVYSPALTDFTVMVDGTSHMFVTGPDVIRTVTGEDVGFEELGGGRTHSTRSGVAHHLAEDEDEALGYVRDLLSFLPSNNLSEPPVLPAEDVRGLEPDELDLSLDAIVPDSANQPYDMGAVIAAVVDDAEFLQVHELFAPNVLCGFGRVEGRTVGIVANQPAQLAGTLDIDASEKAARFVRTCDAFNVPVLTLVDVPGFLPGVGQEHGGIIRRGAKLLHAYAEATVPLVTVITRKAYGGAYIVMGSKEMGADVCLAWPTAQIAVMGAQGAVNILHRGTLKRTAEDGGDVEAHRQQLVTEYEDELANPYVAAERGFIDAVIAPSETRVHVTRALRALATKRASLPAKKHGNIPL